MRGVKVDCSELSAFAEKIGTLNLEGRELFFQAASKDMASRLLELVIPRTPVGKGTQYKTKGRNGKEVMRTSKMGGTLRRGWDAALSGIEVYKVGKSYRVNIINPVHYASYVENGHRQKPGRYVPAIGKRLTKSWVEGQFFLKISEEELQKIAPTALETLLEAFLRTVF